MGPGEHLEVWRWINHTLAAGNWSTETEECYKDFGLGFLSTWKAEHHEYCSPEPGARTASSVDCFMG